MQPGRPRRAHSLPHALYLRPRGPLAQLGERRPCTAEVSGSNPLRSTSDLQGNRTPGHPLWGSESPTDNPLRNALSAAWSGGVRPTKRALPAGNSEPPAQQVAGFELAHQSVHRPCGVRLLLCASPASETIAFPGFSLADFAPPART
jgi:hypothetical protein